MQLFEDFLIEQIQDIVDRATSAKDQLSELANTRADNSEEVSRLHGKIEGVDLMQGHLRRLIEDAKEFDTNGES